MSDSANVSSPKMSVPSVVDVTHSKGNAHIILPERGMMCDISPVWADFNQYHIDHADPDRFDFCRSCVESLTEYRPDKAREFSASIAAAVEESETETTADQSQATENDTEAKDQSPTISDQIPFRAGTAKSNISRAAKQEVTSMEGTVTPLVNGAECDCSNKLGNGRVFQVVGAQDHSYVFEAARYCPICHETYEKYLVLAHEGRLSQEAIDSCEKRVDDNGGAETIDY